MFVTKEGAVVGSIDVAALAALEAGKEDLSKLHKADLVERAEAAGLDPAGMNKADLVEALGSLGGQPVTEPEDGPESEDEPEDEGEG